MLIHTLMDCRWGHGGAILNSEHVLGNDSLMSILAWIQWLGLGNPRALVSDMAHIENIHFRFHKRLLAVLCVYC